MYLNLLTVGTSAYAIVLSLLISTELPLSFSVLKSVSKELCSISCIPPLIHRRGMLDAGGTDYSTLTLSVRKTLDVRFLSEDLSAGVCNIVLFV